MQGVGVRLSKLYLPWTKDYIIHFFVMPVGQVLIITRLHAFRNPLCTALHIRKKQGKFNHLATL